MTDAVTIEVVKLSGIFITLVVSCLAAYTSWRNGKKVKEIHVMINSRMDELLALSREAGKAEEKNKNL